MRYQTFWSRVGAAMIDRIVYLPLVFGLQFTAVSEIWVIGLWLIPHVYAIVAHAIFGQTVGKWVTGVKVVQTHELASIGWTHAMLRESLWIAITIAVLASEGTFMESKISMAISILVVAVAVMTLLHPRYRGLHDFIAKTVVIRTT